MATCDVIEWCKYCLNIFLGLKLKNNPLIFKEKTPKNSQFVFTKNAILDLYSLVLGLFSEKSPSNNPIFSNQVYQLFVLRGDLC